MNYFYDGDISGVISNRHYSDAEFFGAFEVDVRQAHYEITDDEISKIDEGIQTCEDELGDFKEILQEYYQGKKSKEDIQKEYAISKEIFEDKCMWYERLKMGNQMKEFFADGSSNSLSLVVELW